MLKSGERIVFLPEGSETGLQWSDFSLHILKSQAFMSPPWALICEPLLLFPTVWGRTHAGGICASRNVAHTYLFSDSLCGIFSRLKCLYWMFQQLENHHGNGPNDKSPSLLSRVIIAEQSPQSLPFWLWKISHFILLACIWQCAFFGM